MQQMMQEIGAMIVAALVFLMLMEVSSRNSETTATQVLNSVVQASGSEATDIINREFRLIGYGVTDSVKIPWADTSLGIAFKADIADTGSVDSISYLYDHDHHLLTRSINGSPPVPLVTGVKEFDLIYFDANGDRTLSPSAIKTIKVSLMVEGTDKFEDDETFPALYWERMIQPLNLR